MDELKTGGPAFPVTYLHEHVDGSTTSQEWEGMSLLGYFMAHLNEADKYGEWAEWVKVEVLGRPYPDGKVHGWQAVMEFEAEFCAKWRLMRAKAMVKALEEAQ